MTVRSEVRHKIGSVTSRWSTIGGIHSRVAVDLRCDLQRIVLDCCPEILFRVWQSCRLPSQNMHMH